jgi:hypothetical protein
VLKCRFGSSRAVEGQAVFRSYMTLASVVHREWNSVLIERVAMLSPPPLSCRLMSTVAHSRCSWCHTTTNLLPLVSIILATFITGASGKGDNTNYLSFQSVRKRRILHYLSSSSSETRLVPTETYRHSFGRWRYPRLHLHGSLSTEVCSATVPGGHALTMISSDQNTAIIYDSQGVYAPFLLVTCSECD